MMRMMIARNAAGEKAECTGIRYRVLFRRKKRDKAPMFAMFGGGHVSRSVFNSLARTKLPSFLTNVVLQFSFICNKMVSKEGDMDDQSLCEICQTKNH